MPSGKVRRSGLKVGMSNGYCDAITASSLAAGTRERDGEREGEGEWVRGTVGRLQVLLTCMVGSSANTILAWHCCWHPVCVHPYHLPVFK